MVDASHIAEFLKVILAPKYLFGIWIVGALVLFMPGTALDSLGLVGFLNDYRGWIAIITLLVCGLWLSLVGMQFYEGVTEWLERRSSNRNFDAVLTSRLTSLSDGKWFYLRMCLDRGVQTFIGCFFDGHTVSLINKGLLQPGNNSDPWNCPLTIPDPVWEYLVAHRDVIMPTDLTPLRKVIETYNGLRDHQRKNFLRS